MNYINKKKLNVKIFLLIFSVVTNQAKQDGKRKKTKHYFINYNKSTKNQPALLQSMRNLAGCSNEEPELKLVFGPDENVSSMLSEESKCPTYALFRYLLRLLR